MCLTWRAGLDLHKRALTTRALEARGKGKAIYQYLAVRWQKGNQRPSAAARKPSFHEAQAMTRGQAGFWRHGEGGAVSKGLTLLKRSAPAATPGRNRAQGRRGRTDILVYGKITRFVPSGWRKNKSLSKTCLDEGDLTTVRPVDDFKFRQSRSEVRPSRGQPRTCTTRKKEKTGIYFKLQTSALPFEE